MSQPIGCNKNLIFSYVAIGSNATSTAGFPIQTVNLAIQAVETDSVKVISTSRLFVTKAVPEGAGDDFINAVIKVGSRLTAAGLLEHLHHVEAKFGRERKRRWAPRTLDLDLLSHGDEILPNVTIYEKWRDLPVSQQQDEAPDVLVLPHPRLQDRGFVLIPMADIAPDWRHPVLRLTVTQMIDALPEDHKKGAIPLAS